VANKQFYIAIGLKIIAQYQINQLSYPIDYHIETAKVHDLDIAKQSLPYSNLENIDLYAEKAYIDKNFQLNLFDRKRMKLITPQKKTRGQQQFTLFQQAFKTIHSSLRQPIDTLFGRINDQPNIENASTLRSAEGLLYHINVKIVIALIMLIVQFYLVIHIIIY
jgi:hypothetical protein